MPAVTGTQAVSEAVAASLVGATLDSLDSRIHQQSLHRVAGLGIASVAVAVVDKNDLEGCCTRRGKMRTGCRPAPQYQRTMGTAVADADIPEY